MPSGIITSRPQPRPHLVDGSALGLFLFGLPAHVPGADAEEAQHVHLVNFGHAPPVFQQGVVGGIDELRQRQDFTGGFA